MKKQKILRRLVLVEMMAVMCLVAVLLKREEEPLLFASLPDGRGGRGFYQMGGL